MPAIVSPPSCTVRLKRPHAQQQRFLQSSAKRICIKAGRRSGKTTGMAILAVQRFLAGQRILYAVPTAEQVGRFWQEVCMALAEPIVAGLFKKNETEHIIELPSTEQRIRAKTAWSPDTLRGDTCDYLIMDEHQMQDPDCWGVVAAPMLLDRDGSCAFIWTPPSQRMMHRVSSRDPHHAAKLYKMAEEDTTGRWAAFHFTSHDNPHISSAALTEITNDMSAMAYRNEILAEETDDTPGALWTHALLERTRVAPSAAPTLVRVGIAMDPAATSADTSDEMGIVAGGISGDRHGYVLQDASMRGTPHACARAAIFLYDRVQADLITAEANNGGEWIGTVLALVALEMYRNGERASRHLHYKLVHATRNKQTRAEPVSALYEQGRIHHVGAFPELESQMTSWVPGMKSPDRMDSAVWLFSELLLGSGAPMHIRRYAT